jgi:hypothetical protein
MMFGGGAVASAADTNDLVPSPTGIAVQNRVVGRTVANPTVDGSTAVLVITGQSNHGNYSASGSPFTPTNAANIFNFNQCDGGTYLAVEPLLGNDYVDNGVAIRLADALITGGKFTKVILCPMAVGGTSSAQWAAGGAVHGRIGAMASRLRHAHLTPTRVLRHQGESDSGAGVSQATYAANLASEIAEFRAQGITCPIWVCQATYPNASSGIRAAQAAAANGVDVFLGPDTDTLTTGKRAGDGVHFNTSGLADFSTLWYNTF